MDRMQFNRFASAFARHGADGVHLPEFEVGAVGRYSLRYIPFEHVNRSARLVIVGITPGLTQLELAYAAAQRLLREGAPVDVILHEIKKDATFGGPSMRPNLLRMLRHFGLEQLLGVDVGSLWGKNAGLLHATSVVPNAAFVNGEMFAGSFDEVMKSPLLRECFEDCLMPSLREIGKDALYVGLGPCPLEALMYCIDAGVIDRGQVLGAFCHPSTSGGSKTSYYLREKSFDALDPRDPTRRQAAWLDAAYETMRASTTRLGAGPKISASPAVRTVLASAGTAASLGKPRTTGAKPSSPLVAPAVAGQGDFTRMRDVLTGAGYGVMDNTDTNKKLGGFFVPRTRDVIYIDKIASRINSVRVMVHPRLERSCLEALPGVESVSHVHRFHSNMRGFPQRLHRGKTETTFGWQVRIDTLDGLARFAEAFGAMAA